MARTLAPLKPTAPSDDFQRGAVAAEAAAGELGWFAMSLTEQTRAIYTQLRQIDAARARAMAFAPGPRGRFASPAKRQRAAQRPDRRPPPRDLSEKLTTSFSCGRGAPAEA